MYKVNESNEKISYANKEQIRVADIFFWIPGNDKNRKSNDYTKDLRQGVKNKVIDEGCKIQSDQGKYNYGVADNRLTAILTPSLFICMKIQITPILRSKADQKNPEIT